MREDYEYLAESLASLSGLPVRCYIGGKLIGLFHHTQFEPDLAAAAEPYIFAGRKSVSYYMDENLLCYGLFRAKEDDASIVMGPVAPMKLDSTAIAGILRKIGEPVSRTAELSAYFSSMPTYPLRNFLQILCTVNYFINHEKTDVGELILGSENVNRTENPDAVTHTEDSGTEPVIHNTLELEQEMLSYVEYGRTEEMKRLYGSPMKGRAGKMAPDAIRQQKNLIVCTATLVSRAAIRGGLDTETAFGLSDLYIQKSELLNDYVSLSRLNARMVMDFTERVSDAVGGKKQTKLTRKVRNYILAHISASVTTEQIADDVGISRTHFCRLFREQSGMTVSQFVTEIRLSEAKRLLTSSDRSLADIAFCLGFSSQSHFQNVFRKYCGTTPKCYRETGGKAVQEKQV